MASLTPLRKQSSVCCPARLTTPGTHNAFCRINLWREGCICGFDAFVANQYHHFSDCPRNESETHMTDYAMSIDEPIDTEPTQAEKVFDLSTASPEAAAAIAEAIERIRPLDGDQKNNLLDILREDAAAVEEQVRRAFKKVRTAKHDEIMAQFPEPETQKERFQIEAEELVKKHQKAIKKLIKAAGREGVTLKVHTVTYTPKEMVSAHQAVDTSKRDQALMEARQPIDRAEQAALDSIREARDKAHRQIRLAAVSKDATEILKHLPDPAAIEAKVGEAIIAAQADIEAGRPQRGFLGMRKSR